MPDKRSERSTSGSPGARRPRRSREEVSESLIQAAAELFAERPSGRVTVRMIAERASVNQALVHRYFGTKTNLMRAALARSQNAIAASVTGMSDLRRDVDAVFRALFDEKEFIAALARASLDGVLPDFPAGYPTMAGLLERILAERGDEGDAGRHDPRVIVASLASLTLGYAIFGQFVRRGTGLDGLPDDEVEAALIEVLRDMVGMALDPPGAPPDASA